jgi:hypothetical protein
MSPADVLAVEGVVAGALSGITWATLPHDTDVVLVAAGSLVLSAASFLMAYYFKQREMRAGGR